MTIVFKSSEIIDILLGSYIVFQEHLFQPVDVVIEHIVIHEVRLPTILNIILDIIFDILDL